MTRRLVRLSPEAAEWLKSEITYLAERSPAAAKKLASKIRAARESLSKYPKLGPPGLIPGTRRLVVSPYVLTLRTRDGIVEIVAIRHARQSDAYAPREVLDDAADDEPAPPSSTRR